MIKDIPWFQGIQASARYVALSSLVMGCLFLLRTYFIGCLVLSCPVFSCVSCFVVDFPFLVVVLSCVCVVFILRSSCPFLSCGCLVLVVLWLSCRVVCCVAVCSVVLSCGCVVFSCLFQCCLVFWLSFGCLVVFLFCVPVLLLI
jgi:hypothetical protein